MIVLGCGGRKYSNIQKVFNVLDGIHARTPITEMPNGMATGADELCRAWAKANDVPIIKFKARWATYGKSAGPIRNQLMLVEGKPELVVAFPGGNGTSDMIGRAKKAGVRVIQIKDTPITTTENP